MKKGGYNRVPQENMVGSMFVSKFANEVLYIPPNPHAHLASQMVADDLSPCPLLACVPGILVAFSFHSSLIVIPSRLEFATSVLHSSIFAFSQMGTSSLSLVAVA